MSEKANQRGMTIVELIIVASITSLIMSGLGTAIYLITNVTQRGNDETTALHDIRQAAYYISGDAQMASVTDLVDEADPVENLSLEWTDSSGNSHSSSYWLSGTRLLREYDSNTITVARNVSALEFSISGDVLTFHVESTPAGRWQVSKESTSMVQLRPDMQS